MNRILLSLTLIFVSATLFAQQDTLPVPSSYSVNGVTFKMVRVEKGDFWMGAQHVDAQDVNFDRLAQSDELPVHNVKIKEDFLIGQTEVTQQLWKAVMGHNPSRRKCMKRPVTNVSYDDIQEFIVILDSLTGMQFRLPTEEEWEYAARGGKRSRGYVFSGSNDVTRVAWTTENARNTRKVGKRTPNELGIYDMSGNVWEWCSSTYRYYDRERNAKLGKEGMMRCIRGGACQLPASSARVSWRGKRMPDAKNSFGGFRLCLDAKYVKQESVEKEIVTAEATNDSIPATPKLSKREQRKLKKAEQNAAKEEPSVSEP